MTIIQNKFCASLFCLFSGLIFVPDGTASSHGCYVTSTDPFSCSSQLITCYSDVNANFNLYGYTVGAVCEAVVSSGNNLKTCNDQLKAEQDQHALCKNNLDDSLDQGTSSEQKLTECKNYVTDLGNKLNTCSADLDSIYKERYVDGFNTCVASCNNNIAKANVEIRRLKSTLSRLRKQMRSK